MRHKTIHPRANMHMLALLDHLNGTQHNQVLPEIFTLCRFIFFLAIVQIRHKFRVACLALTEGCPVAQINWQAAQEGVWVEAEFPGEEPVEFY
jgi:hypothetical protein